MNGDSHLRSEKRRIFIIFSGMVWKRGGGGVTYMTYCLMTCLLCSLRHVAPSAEYLRAYLKKFPPPTPSKAKCENPSMDKDMNRIYNYIDISYENHYHSYQQIDKRKHDQIQRRASETEL